MKQKIAFTAVSVFAALQVHAADGGFEVKGHFDSYYQFSPQGHSPSGSGGGSYVEGRSFDNSQSQIVMNMVEIGLTKQVERVTLKLDVGFGPMVESMSVNGTIDPVTGQPQSSDVEATRNVLQALATYKSSADARLSVSVGKFYAPIGFEVFHAQENWQYSRSYTYNSTPFWFQGVNASYAIVPDRLTATAYLVNAVDGRISQERSRSATVALNLTATPAEGLNAAYTYIGGNETNTPGSRREFHNLNLSYAVLPQLSAAADMTLGSQKKAVAGGGDARWTIMALYLKWSPLSWYALSPRWEVFDDSDKGFVVSGGYAGAGVKQKVQALTVSNSFVLASGLESRLEYRHDRSDADGYFLKTDRTPARHQDTYTAALLFRF